MSLILPEYAQGWSFPEQGLDGEDLSVVRCPATCGIVYTAGMPGEGHMETELSRMWIEGAEHGTGVCVLTYGTHQVGRGYEEFTRFNGPVKHAAAAAMHCCIAGEELAVNDRIEVSELATRDADPLFQHLLSQWGMPSLSIYRNTDRLGRAGNVRALLEQQFPWLQGAVPIPRETAPVQQ